MCGAQGSKQINKQTKNHPEKFGNMSRILVTAELIFFFFFLSFFFLGGGGTCVWRPLGWGGGSVARPGGGVCVSAWRENEHVS